MGSIVELNSEVSVGRISYDNVNRNVYNITHDELNNSKFKYNIGRHMISIPKETTINVFFEDPVIKKILYYGYSVTAECDEVIDENTNIFINGNKWILEII